ncbi:Tensin-3 [Blomia tropicalis]|nr:Tensin-3 [Blomia tropicalis]
MNDHLSSLKKHSITKFGFKPSNGVKRRSSFGRDSNYSDIGDLYECVTNLSIAVNSDSSHREVTKPHNILYLVRINPFKFSTMEPLNVDSRLIVFSLLDSFTKLSPNKIFESFIEKLKEDGQTNITIFNLSEPLEYMRQSLDVPVVEFGWPERHAPSLEKLCALCKAIDSWLALDSTRNIAIIYSKRDLSRASLAIGVFLQYVHICLGDDSTFDYESMQNYYEHNLRQYMQPSQQRYIGYFRNLLSGDSQINNQQFHLNHVIIHKVPNFDGNGLCRPFIKIYQGMNLIYGSPLLNLNDHYLDRHDSVVFTLDPPLKLRGEILIKCYHKKLNPTARTVMFSLQFHTGTLQSDTIMFARDDIDIALYDKRFHADTQIQLMFNDARLEVNALDDYDDDVMKTTDDDDLITKWNSYENFFAEDGTLEYTKGPLDGSLYATIPKRSNTQLNSTPSITDEHKLDELLNEIFMEIESFPDMTVDNSSHNKTGNDDGVNVVQVERSPVTVDTLVSPSSPVQSEPEAGSETFIINDTVDSFNSQQLTWLQKQQIKLKNKQHGKYQQTRLNFEKRLIEELKCTITCNNGKNLSSSEHDETSNSVPAIPVRTSSKNLSPLFAEHYDLERTVQTLSLERTDSIQSNGSSQYQSLSQYSPLPNSSSPISLNRTVKQNGETKHHNNMHRQSSNHQEQSSPIQRPITPSFPVKPDHRRSILLSPVNDQISMGNVPLFINDTSNFWYKPHISREEAIKLLKDKPSGTFIIRDSNSFQGAYGLALKFANHEDIHVPESVRHFLIESTHKGVQIKGCPDEPVFSSLAALVYQHSITRISLPTRLIIPSVDIETDESNSYLTRIYENGAACNVIYFVCQDIESLTGDVAITKVIDTLKQAKPNQIKSAMVHFKASNKGITLTDNSHKIFFRQHYPLQTISHCSMDPNNRTLVYTHDGNRVQSELFGFVARKKGSNTDNECLIFGQFESDQPSQAIVDFVNKLMTL